MRIYIRMIYKSIALKQNIMVEVLDYVLTECVLITSAVREFLIFKYDIHVKPQFFRHTLYIYR